MEDVAIGKGSIVSTWLFHWGYNEEHGTRKTLKFASGGQEEWIAYVQKLHAVLCFILWNWPNPNPPCAYIIVSSDIKLINAPTSQNLRFVVKRVGRYTYL